MRSNLWSMRENTSATAVLLLIMQTARCTLARSPPATAALTSFGTTSPRYIRQHAMYLPCLGSHFAIMLAGSNTAFVILGADNCSW
ncbi:hypothetical protein QQP08_024582 [Theobroma cacao]|nr:hypothetical protein QQP08_024582 [Theobroma cacao]